MLSIFFPKNYLTQVPFFIFENASAVPLWLVKIGAAGFPMARLSSLSRTSGQDAERRGSACTNPIPERAREFSLWREWTSEENGELATLESRVSHSLPAETRVRREIHPSEDEGRRGVSSTGRNEPCRVSNWKHRYARRRTQPAGGTEESGSRRTRKTVYWNDENFSATKKNVDYLLT